ncbi:sulfatase [Stieleria sp. ICT_E10.1]|uniref:sulfatase n=1 Tax=Stieleria sedimenti TaxID=2976331 RepID=UPI002180500A|nr:sulfatase [Stieleria sedimenti]MCS7467110.1 sulfatase [Stieleria sedimenti]
MPRFLAALIGCVFATSILSHPTVHARSPNVVFFLVDDLGFMDVGVNNPKSFYETPNIDRLADRGTNFTDGYAANPVCSPTRFSILTGRYPTRADATNFFSGKRSGRFLPAVLNDHMPLSEVTMAEAFKQHGYHTMFAGKWHLGPSEEFWPTRQGFDLNFGGYSRGGPYGGKRYFSPYGNPRLTDGPDGEHLPIRLAQETANFISDNKADPFFAYLAFYSVHTPLLAPEALVKKYEEKAERLGLNAQEAFADEEQVWPDAKQPRRVRTLQAHATYAAMVESMDRAVGIVIDRLEALGLMDETIICLTSDNGGLSTSEGSPTSNLPLRGGKGWVYEGGIREAFMIHAPMIKDAPKSCNVPVVSTDFYPTLLQLAGLPPLPQQHLDGVSLVPLLKGAKKLDRDAIYWHYPHYSNQGGFPGGAIRMGDWKLVERYEDGTVHLYNLAEDVGEQNDLADQQPERVATMREKLHRWYQDVDAKFLRPKDNGPMPWQP